MKRGSGEESGGDLSLRERTKSESRLSFRIRVFFHPIYMILEQ